MPSGRRLSYDFAIAEARKHGNSKALTQLQAIGPPPYVSVDDLLAVETWAQRFGGVNQADLSNGTLILIALRAEEANLIDLVKFGQGNHFSLTHLEGEMSQPDLTEHDRSFAVPDCFCAGALRSTHSF